MSESSAGRRFSDTVRERAAADPEFAHALTRETLSEVGEVIDRLLRGDHDGWDKTLATLRTVISTALEESQPTQAKLREVYASLANYAVVAAICAHQVRHDRHPLTCGNDSNHPPLFPVIEENRRVVLLCAACDYRQENVDGISKLMAGHLR